MTQGVMSLRVYTLSHSPALYTFIVLITSTRDDMGDFARGNDISLKAHEVDQVFSCRMFTVDIDVHYDV